MNRERMQGPTHEGREREATAADVRNDERVQEALDDALALALAVRRIVVALSEIHDGKAFTTWNPTHGHIAIWPGDLRIIIDGGADHYARMRVIQALSKTDAKTLSAWAGPTCATVTRIIVADVARLVGEYA